MRINKGSISKKLLKSDSKFQKSPTISNLVNESNENILKHPKNLNKTINFVRSIFRKENWNFNNLIDIDSKLGFSISNLWFLDLENSSLFKSTVFVDSLKKLMKMNYVTDNVSFVNVRNISVTNYSNFKDKIDQFFQKIRSLNFHFPDEEQVQKYPFIYKELHDLIENRKIVLDLKNEQYSDMFSKLQKLCPSFMSASQSTSSELDSMVKFLDLAFEDFQTPKREEEGKIYAKFERVQSKLIGLNNLNALHSILFCDIIRQISLDCAKRGYMIAKIWNFSMNVTKAAVECLNQCMAHVTTLYVKERNLLDNLYSKMHRENLNRVTVLEEKVSDLTSTIKSQSQKLNSSLRSEKNLRNKVKKYKIAFREIKKEVDRIKWERRKVAIRLIVNSDLKIIKGSPG